MVGRNAVEEYMEKVGVRKERIKIKKRSLPPLLIVGTGPITVGLRKGGEESLPSDQQLKLR